jgi:hypothetical protein
VPLPGDQVPFDAQAMMRRLDDLERMVREQGAAKSSEATSITGGTLRVSDTNGQDIARIGLVPSIFGPDPRPGLDLIRPGGNKVLHFETPGWFALYDTGGGIILSDDIATGRGLARPWLPVQLHSCFVSATGDDTAGEVTAYDQIAVSKVTSETVMWEGIAPISHPYLQVAGLWGTATGANSATYRLKVAGETVRTWTTGALEYSVKDPALVTKWTGLDWVQVQITVVASGTGTVACAARGCYLRQS